jgi:hypothetical protein
MTDSAYTHTEGAFPNTPRWSARRFGMILALFMSGVIMIGLGVHPGIAEARALRLIDAGTECLMFSSLGFAFAASAERIGGWWTAKRPVAAS